MTTTAPKLVTADELLAWAAQHEVKPVQPRVEGHGETARIVIDEQ